MFFVLYVTYYYYLLLLYTIYVIYCMLLGVIITTAPINSIYLFIYIK